MALLALALATTVTAGCASKSETSGATQPANTSSGSADAAKGGSVKAMTAETTAEKNALVSAATPQGRKWAAGNPNGTESAAGDPFLAGYSVYLIDGSSFYQVWVLNGVAVPFTGKTGPMYVKSANDGYNTAVSAASKNQEAAVAAAQAAIKDVAPNAKPGGTGQFIVFFPFVNNAAGGYYPHVTVYAVPGVTTDGIASGGTQYR